MQRSAIVIICRLSVTRVYCDKTAAVRIVQFSINVAQYLYSLPAKFDDKIRRRPSIWGLKVGWGGFRLRVAVSPKRCKIELR